ncbi:MAG: YceI family protein [Pseudomonadota bacterium]|nr:YceI family protein [Pseudomonadota bacterium]
MTKPFLIALAVAFAAASPVAPIFAATAPDAVPSGSYVVEPNHTRIQFAVDHMGITEFYGDFTGASGALALDAQAPEHSHVDVSIPTASVSTTNATLDGELRGAQWLNAAANPTIRFVSDRVEPTGQGHARISGTLTLHGVSRPVVLDAQFHGAGINPMSKAMTVGFDATAHILRSDFGVKTYLPLIGDDINIRISAAFERKPG